MKICLDFLKNNLKNNLSKLLSLYPMKSRELERIVLVDHKTLDAYKTKTRIPGALTMLSIASTFGTTTDWLFGMSYNPYTEESIKYAEEQCYMKFQENIPYKLDDNYNVIHYNNLEAIANLIVLQQYKHILSETSFKSSRLKKIEEWINEINETGEAKFTLLTYGNKN